MAVSHAVQGVAACVSFDLLTLHLLLSAAGCFAVLPVLVECAVIMVLCHLKHPCVVGMLPVHLFVTAAA